MTGAQLGWAAGIIDGEGCILVERHAYRSGKSRQLMQPGHVLYVRVRNTDHLMLTTLQRLCGGSVRACLAESIALPGRKPIWTWRVAAKEARAVLRLLEPYLVAKREQAHLALTLPYKAHRGARSQDFIAASEVVRLQLMALHHAPHQPEGSPPELVVIRGDGEQVAMPLLTAEDQSNESMEVSNG